MLNGQRVVVVMPAFRAEQTLRATYDAIPHDIVDQVLLTDDASDDRTAAMLRPHDDSLRLRISRIAIPTSTSRNMASERLSERWKGPNAGLVIVHPDWRLRSQFHWNSS